MESAIRIAICNAWRLGEQGTLMAGRMTRHKGLPGSASAPDSRVGDDISSVVDRMRRIRKLDAAGRTYAERERLVIEAIRRAGPIGRIPAG